MLLWILHDLTLEFIWNVEKNNFPPISLNVLHPIIFCATFPIKMEKEKLYIFFPNEEKLFINRKQEIFRHVWSQRRGWRK